MNVSWMTPTIQVMSLSIPTYQPSIHGGLFWFSFISLVRKTFTIQKKQEGPCCWILGLGKEQIRSNFLVHERPTTTNVSYSSSGPASLNLRKFLNMGMWRTETSTSGGCRGHQCFWDVTALWYTTAWPPLHLCTSRQHALNFCFTWRCHPSPHEHS